jgi:tetratricopeptide (TPR) repeat protein
VLERQFPDGQLFIDLHGHSRLPPVEPAAALDTLLRQLGIPAAQVASDLDERVAQWRAELATRRAIVVLDNAATTAQVNPLVPASSGCFVIVTSRRRLIDLDGSRPFALGILGHDDSVALLERIVGPRVAAEPEATAEVAKRCGYLPLALRLAAARLAHRPRWRVRDLADRLGALQSPLAELTAGERTVTDAFALSYSQLSPANQRLFQLLAAQTGDHFDVYVAAALGNTGLGEAQRLLDELVATHLIQEMAANRYQFHDLIRAYAAELAEKTHKPTDDRDAAERVLDYYVHAAAAASDSLESPASRRNFVLGEAIRPDLINRQFTRAMDWLEMQRPNLIAAIRRAEALGHDRYTWQLSRAMWSFLYLRCHLDDLIDTHQRGLAAAERLSDPRAVATMHNYLASAYFRRWRPAQAIEHMRRAIALRQQTGDRADEAIARKNLALVYATDGQVDDATAQIEHGLAIARRLGDPHVHASTVANAGAVYLEIGRYEQALRHSRRGLMLAREVGDEQLHAVALGNVGVSRARLGDLSPALRVLIAALGAKRRVQSRYGEGETLNEIGAVCRSLGRVHEAIPHHRRAMAIMREVGDRHGQCAVYNEFGRTLHTAGDTTAALELYEQAMAIAVRMRYRLGRARALDGIAACLRDTDPESARRHWQRALSLYRELDVSEWHAVERQLANVV